MAFERGRAAAPANTGNGDSKRPLAGTENTTDAGRNAPPTDTLKQQLVATKSPGQRFTAACQRKIESKMRDLLENDPPVAVIPDYRPLPKLDRLQELFKYNPETGRLTARIARGGLKVGDEVGTPLHGYRAVFIDYAQWRVHRIAFKMHHRREPVGVVHHCNGNRSDNRACNLEEATPLANSQRRHVACSNTATIGVSWCKTSKRYCADIGWKNRVVHLGRFVRLECAKEARLCAERVLFGFDRREIPDREAA